MANDSDLKPPLDLGAHLSERQQQDVIDVLVSVYNGGYSKQRLTFEERRQLRAKAYRALKALGVEK